MWLRWIIFLTAFIISSSFVSTTPNRIVCYYGSWAVYRPGYGKFDVEDIDPHICTHINFAFVGINSNGSVKVLDSWNEIDRGAFKRFSGLKQYNDTLKTLIAIGGWNEGSTVFSQVANSPSLRDNLIKSAVHAIKTYGFDGFDLDWEYPAQRGGAAYDKVNFITLLREFREEFDKHGYLLTAAVASAADSVDLSYDVNGANQYLDFINVMTYDLHGIWDGATGHNSPLYASVHDVTEYQKTLNVDSCIKGWISRGASPEKLNLGMGTYGRTFTLADPSNTGLGSISYNGGTPGPYTRETGFLGYNEICANLRDGWTRSWLEDQQVPYAYKGNQWVSYDDEESISLKVEYAKSLGLGGLMIWSLETDDFRGHCGDRNSLLNSIRIALGWPSSNVTVGETEPEGTTPGDGGDGGSNPGPELCQKEGYIRDSEDCSKFYYCQFHAGSYILHSYHCPFGLVYDLRINACNWPNLVNCET